MDNWLTATAATLGRGIADGTIDARDLTEAYLDAIGRHPFAERIFARTAPDRARAEAAAMTEVKEVHEETLSASFDGRVIGIIFCVAMSEYDQVLHEDETTVRIN